MAGRKSPLFGGLLVHPGNKIVEVGRSGSRRLAMRKAEQAMRQRYRTLCGALGSIRSAWPLWSQDTWP